MSNTKYIITETSQEGILLKEALFEWMANNEMSNEDFIIKFSEGIVLFLTDIAKILGTDPNSFVHKFGRLFETAILEEYADQERA